MKICRNCLQLRHGTDFDLKADGRNRRLWCRICQTAYEYLYTRAQGHGWYQPDLFGYIPELPEHHCAYCGEMKPLTKFKIIISNGNLRADSWCFQCRRRYHYDYCVSKVLPRRREAKARAKETEA